MIYDNNLTYEVILHLMKYVIPTSGFMVVGDINQLPPYCDSVGEAKQMAGCSILERLIGTGCVTIHTTLNHRMHRLLCILLSRWGYCDTMSPAPGINDVLFDRMRRMFSWPCAYPVLFVNVAGSGEEPSAGRSRRNVEEAEVVMWAHNRIRRRCPNNTVRCLTFYEGQLTLIKRLLEEDEDVTVNSPPTTVDSAQGDEEDCIILSCVRSNIGQKIGFLRDSARLIVALSRARYLTIIIGDAETLRASPILEMVIQTAWDCHFYVNGHEEMEAILTDNHEKNPASSDLVDLSHVHMRPGLEEDIASVLQYLRNTVNS